MAGDEFHTGYAAILSNDYIQPNRALDSGLSCEGRILGLGYFDQVCGLEIHADANWPRHFEHPIVGSGDVAIVGGGVVFHIGADTP